MAMTLIGGGVATPTMVAGAAPAYGKPVYIVQGASVAATQGLLRQERRRGTRIVHRYRHVLSGFAAALGPRDVVRLRRSPGVVRVMRDVSRLSIQDTLRRATATGLWGLDRIDQRALPLDGWIATLADGRGVDAYVVDSGIRSAQVQFAGRLRPGYSAVADARGTEDCNGHGTRVAGVVAGAETGVAPAATLVPVRVVDCQGNGDGASLVAGLDWVIGHHRAGAPAVANISLVGPRSRLIDRAVAAAVADGISVVVAAGNAPVDACGSSPAGEPTAITASASTQQDIAAPFAAWGPCIDLYAPGDAVLTTVTRPRVGAAREAQVAFASGTSMSAAFASGGAALALSASPGMSPADVESALRGTATAGVLGEVPPGTPNLLLWVAAAAPPPPVGLRPATPPALSGLRASFVRAGTALPIRGRYRIGGTTSHAGVLTVQRAGRLLSRRHVAEGRFAFRTRKLARRISTVRFSLVPDDPVLTSSSALVRVGGR